MHIDPEQPGSLQELGLEAAWGNAFIEDDGTELVAAFRALGPRVVLDWGFPPEWLNIVEDFKQNGVELWWFDAPHAKAREEFIRRGIVPVEALVRQMEAIAEEWEEILNVFHPNVVAVIGEDGRRMEPEMVWQMIRSHVA